MRLFLLLWSCIFCFRSGAHPPREGQIHGSIGPFIFQTVSRDFHFSSSIDRGFRLSALGDVDQNGEIEIALDFLQDKMVSLERDQKILDERSDRVVITSGYRHWLSPRWGVGAGFSSSYLMGGVTTLRNDFGANRPKTSARDQTEYGVELSLQFEPLHTGNSSLVLDSRYWLSLTSKEGEEQDHCGVGLSWKYFIQGREVSKAMAN